MKKRRKRETAADRELASIPTVEAVEKAIGLKASRWVNRCHEIACKMLDAGLVMGFERYGHYHGAVSRKHPRYGLPFQRHGWIETPRGLVVDPTRWAFRMVEPYIYYGPGLDYDAAGQRLAASRIRAYPRGPRDESGDSPLLTDLQRTARCKIIQLDVTGAARDHLARLTGGQVANFNIDQIFWLGNLPLAWLEEHAAAIYGAMARAGHKAVIPIDCWRMAMGQPVASNLP